MNSLVWKSLITAMKAEPSANTVNSGGLAATHDGRRVCRTCCHSCSNQSYSLAQPQQPIVFVHSEGMGEAARLMAASHPVR